jgi:heme/copper-type cytochrome/quinol oxidase subunit 2
MDIKGLIFGTPQTAPIGEDIRNPVIGWIIAVFSIFTAFAFWGWLSSWLIEYAREKGLSTSSVYLIIFAVSLSILAGSFVFYWYFIKSRSDVPPDHNPSSIRIKEKK